MGILNITPDSFYSGSRLVKTVDILSRAEKMIQDGLDIIDIGGYSSRPGAEDIGIEEELARVMKALNVIVREFPQIPVSVDTFRSTIARQCIENGAAMINDISAGMLDEKMMEVVCDLQVPYVIMHMKGNPRNMLDHTEYDDILEETIDFLQKRKRILTQNGLNDVIVDVGFGFSKTTGQNYELLKDLSYFTGLESPILVGLSRKSMIWRSLDCTPEEALNGTTALHMAALQNGADILRVHDVKEAVEVIKLFKLING